VALEAFEGGFDERLAADVGVVAFEAGFGGGHEAMMHSLAARRFAQLLLAARRLRAS
jgi:hypothetical protein